LTSHGGRSDPGERVHDYTPGLAWAARRELMEREGFYDAMVVGGGDSAMAKAAIGQHVDFADYVGLDGAQRGHYLAWAERFHGAVAGRIAVLPGTAYSLWHGDVARRRYRSRHSILRRHRFDPSTDVEIDDGGAFRWSSKKPAMHQEVRAYFAPRREDESAVGSALGIGPRVREHDLEQKAS
jgi:hypothetical protein